ncbi:MAG: Xaa-Pro dipeptidase [Chloroflexota bacterium]|jgi:Xaa-Pro aminopeptidase|nr:Xaa-Pro dipeptidase [Chloroflexota bacterium]
MLTPADTTWNGFSLAERDLRWAKVREQAAQAGFDCTLVPLCVDGRNLHLSLEQARGTRSDGRYLTLLENAAVVLPTDGRPPIVITEDGTGNAWVPEPRAAGPELFSEWAPATADALRELGMERARIAVSGMLGGKVTHGRAADGVINHTAFAEVQRRLPNASFENGTEVVGFARYKKSDEEREALRIGAHIANAGIDEMVEVARPGMNAATVYGRVVRRMLELGSEYYPLAVRISPLGSQNPPRYEEPPYHITLGEGMLLAPEVDAVVGGLIAQEMQPILLGKIPDEWKPVIELQREVFYAGLEYMKPGRPFGDMIEFINGFGPKRGMKTIILMHGRGYGNDGPLLTPADTRAYAFKDVPVEKGNVWVWKPSALSADGKLSMSFGGVTIVDDDGGHLVTGRPAGMISIA